ncbi:hypothetical protein PIB30_098592 [Stylosanthes scabra]|uniref:Uncharacterized protein n=1 Tax=Stylosanthes scabra TaxID=79078 RepID=A0ABU6ZVR2_9FABA|nr:hypothetical protein [Stylosanthes scabra]
MGWGFSLRIFQTFQVQLQAWKVAKYVVNRYGLNYPVVRVFSLQSSVCSAAISAERVRSAVSHIGVLQFLVSEQFFTCEPEEGNCYASEHNLNQGIMRKMLPKAII